MANILGLITVNGKDVLEVDADPAAGGGTPANPGSFAMFDNAGTGSVYVKTGAADTAWSMVSTSGGSFWQLAGNTVGSEQDFGTVDDFDIPIIRNNIELGRYVGTTAATQGFLIGLNASLGGRLQLSPSAIGDDIFKEVLSPTSNPVIHVTRMSRVTTVGAASAVFNIAIPSDYNAQLCVRSTAVQTAGSVGVVGDGASYIRTCHARNIAGATTLFKQQTDYTYEIVNALNFDLSASGANIVGTCTGATNRNLSWGLHVDLLMLTT